ncbi:Pho80p PWA37_002174 [Arxiozyma heterogenica]|uniref:Cyclin n=1 Tax=Arxiozyma heterogenica TaxID=278026 RepID=A0AAN7WS87_9SACH|nr:hypothetical protein RI543_001637 [Kazachstania heterogenica]
MRNVSSGLDVQEQTAASIPTVVLPTDFSKCPRTDLIALISRMLVFLIHINEKNKKSNSKNQSHEVKLTRFHSSAPPSISVYNYLLRLAKYSSIEQCVFLTSLYYIDLLSSVYKDFTLDSLTVHRFLLTSTTVASKGLCDTFCTNAHYAKVGGVQCSELNLLEREFLRRINYRILPRDDNITLCKYESHLGKVVITDKIEYEYVLKNTKNHENSGYNVLNTYYRKIIQLVGKFSLATDISRRANFVLEDTLSHIVQNDNNGKKRSFEAIQASLHGDLGLSASYTLQGNTFHNYSDEKKALKKQK